MSTVALDAYSPTGEPLTFNGIHNPFFPFCSSHQTSRAVDYMSPWKALRLFLVELKQVLMEINCTIVLIQSLDIL
jgi:hypothetical protein